MSILPALRVRLLGPVQIEQDGTPLQKIGSQKSLLLLAYLIRQPHEHSRAKLASLLWIDQPAAKARSNLRWALNNLSNLLPNCLNATRQTLRVVPAHALWVDLHQFDTWSTTPPVDSAIPNSLSQAVDLYRGEFLEGLVVDGAPELDLWLLQEREFWRRRVTSLLEQLIKQQITATQFYHAERFVSQLLTLEPEHEEAHRQLMWLLAMTGQRHAALNQFEICRNVLAAELAVEPAAATITLYAQIRDNILPVLPTATPEFAVQLAVDSATSAAESTASGARVPIPADWGEAPMIRELYGREAESARLAGWLVDETSRLILLIGMGGMGKTTLAAQTARSLAEQFDTVIWRSLVVAPTVSAIIRSWVQILSAQRLLEWPDALDEQIRILLHHLQEHRTLLILDNLESVLQSNERAGYYRPGYEGYGELLQAIGGTTHQSCLLLTSREEPQGFTPLSENGAARKCELVGLDLNAGRMLLAERGLIGSLTTEVALVRRASGSPMALKLIAETIHDLFAGDIGAFLSDETFIFDDLRAMLDQQFQRLSALEQTILIWLAIEREGTQLAELQMSLTPPVPRQNFLEAIRSLERRSMLESADSRIALPNVIIEHTTAYLIATVCREIVEERPELLRRHALCKATGREYIRQSQRALIVQPLLEQLEMQLGRSQVDAKLRRLLVQLRQERQTTQQPFDLLLSPLVPDTGIQGDYAPGNLLHLLIELGSDLQGWDFSALPIRQADLRNINLSQTDFRHAAFAQCLFTETFGLVHAVAFHPSGQELAATAEHEIRFWRDPDGQRTLLLRGHTDDVWSLAFHPDGATLPVGAGIKRYGFGIWPPNKQFVR
ncbi:MAG: BTAD domain-containing putative transcriptional regulator [Caldilineaceae bacterium]